MKDEIVNVSLSSVAQALATDYFCIYYINTENNKFIEYSASPEYKAFGLPTAGDDIISFSRNQFEEILFPEDREMFLETFTKENVIAALNERNTFTMTFRMMFRDGPTYVHLKVTRMIEKDRRHAVIGISSVDEVMRAREAFEKAHQASVTYSRIAQALAGDYFSIHVVDPVTDEFIAYSSLNEYGKVGAEKAGEDYFGTVRKTMERMIHPEDKNRFMEIFTKEKVLAITERDGHFTTKYRLTLDDAPVYVSMKATFLEDKDGIHLIVGTNNIDAQIKREEEYKRRMANARTSARNDFLANMSHDIRTPMNAIVGYTNIAKRCQNDPEAVSDALDKIGSSSHFLLSLINDVLDISKIESGKMQLTVGPCDLLAILRRIEDITSLQAASKSLNISYSKEKVRHFRVLGDELRIEQILINIVSNAVKYTPEGKDVMLIAEEESLPESGKSRYRFVIRDTGVGISEDYLPYIFDSFTREQDTRTNRIQGTGLGLAITSKIVQQMEGTISVKSKRGEGSEFTVELDLEPIQEEGTEGPEDSGADGAGALAGKRVLLVEDNDINAEIAEMVLEQYGVTTERAENGKVGVAMVSGSRDGYYDAVLMDIQMPEMNGYEATRAIRALDRAYARRLPIIAMSANAYDEDVRNCLEAGMNAHVAKPFQPDELAAVLRSHLSGDKEQESQAM